MDLLDPSKNKLEVKEDKQRGIFIQDCTEIYVSSVLEMRNTMHRGSMNRKIAFTGMNEKSSRSHSIFIVHLHQKDTKKGSTKMAKLYFVDLAGSEKVSKTGVTGQQL
jgi:kinesin family protein 5